MSDLSVSIETNKGTINLNLYPDLVPITVANFVNLALRGFYDGLVFHRVIPEFMIQGGCPQGTGTGGPGYKFEDEFSPNLRHDAPGKFSMANSGPGTNGSQFFITHVPTPWLDDAHSILGVVASDVDQAIVDSIDQGDTITSISFTGDTDAVLAAESSKVAQWDKKLG
jgi:peptidyl-prolyl cis-trans isomerase B (cyclophilin B)